MPLSLSDCALISKLFFGNSSNTAVPVTLSEFRHAKGMYKEKGPLTQCLVRRIVKKIRGDWIVYYRKPVPLPMQEEIATAIVESLGTPEASNSAHGVAQELDIPYATVRKILRNVIYFYPNKISHQQQLSPGEVQQRMECSDICSPMPSHVRFYGKMKPTFI